MNLRAALFFLVAPAIAFGSDLWFRRDADTISWILHLEGERYQIETCHFSGQQTKAEGVATVAESAITFKDTSPAASPSLVHAKRFLKRKLGDVLYLVEAQREKEFIEATEEKEEFLRRMFLRNFLHQISKPAAEKRGANHAPVPMPTSVTAPAGQEPHQP